MVIAILNHKTKTVSVITVSDEDLKPFDYDIEMYLNEKDLINNESDWMSDVNNLIINDFNRIITT